MSKTNIKSRSDIGAASIDDNNHSHALLRECFIPHIFQPQIWWHCYLTLAKIKPVVNNTVVRHMCLYRGMLTSQHPSIGAVLTFGDFSLESCHHKLGHCLLKVTEMSTLPRSIHPTLIVPGLAVIEVWVTWFCNPNFELQSLRLPEKDRTTIYQIACIDRLVNISLGVFRRAPPQATYPASWAISWLCPQKKVLFVYNVESLNI